MIRPSTAHGVRPRRPAVREGGCSGRFGSCRRSSDGGPENAMISAFVKGSTKMIVQVTHQQYGGLILYAAERM